MTILASNGGRACGGTSPSGTLPGKTPPRAGIGAGFSAAGSGAAGAGPGTGAASALSISAMRLPSATSSPTLSLISLTTPANGAGTSIVALSDSSVTRLWSLLTLSPTFTRISITGTLSKPPMSGTRASRTPAGPAAGAAAGAGALFAGASALAAAGAEAGAGAGAGAGATAAPSASIIAITVPSATSSPSATLISFTTPANGAGTSIVALSDSSVIRLCSFSTRSPTLIKISITGTLSPPISGTRASLRSAMGTPGNGGGPRGNGPRQDFHHNQGAQRAGLKTCAKTPFVHVWHDLGRMPARTRARTLGHAGAAVATQGGTHAGHSRSVQDLRQRRARAARGDPRHPVRHVRAARTQRGGQVLADAHDR